MIQQQVLNEVIVEKGKRGAASARHKVSISGEPAPVAFPGERPLVAVSSTVLSGLFLIYFDHRAYISPTLLQPFLPSFLQ